MYVRRNEGVVGVFQDTSDQMDTQKGNTRRTTVLDRK